MDSTAFPLLTEQRGERKKTTRLSMVEAAKEGIKQKKGNVSQKPLTWETALPLLLSTPSELDNYIMTCPEFGIQGLGRLKAFKKKVGWDDPLTELERQEREKKECIASIVRGDRLRVLYSYTDGKGIKADDADTRAKEGASEEGRSRKGRSMSESSVSTVSYIQFDDLEALRSGTISVAGSRPPSPRNEDSMGEWEIVEAVKAEGGSRGNNGDSKDGDVTHEKIIEPGYHVIAKAAEEAIPVNRGKPKTIAQTTSKEIEASETIESKLTRNMMKAFLERRVGDANTATGPPVRIVDNKNKKVSKGDTLNRGESAKDKTRPQAGKNTDTPPQPAKPQSTKPPDPLPHTNPNLPPTFIPPHLRAVQKLRDAQAAVIQPETPKKNDVPKPAGNPPLVSQKVTAISKTHESPAVIKAYTEHTFLEKLIHGSHVIYTLGVTFAPR
ncbi:hypothetical protein ABW19_dt0210301 [Dactylella cylindrospora]|nr:hypothetical protein ABW19_dt0210301 [Dactylella cylindrospora]